VSSKAELIATGDQEDAPRAHAPVAAAAPAVAAAEGLVGRLLGGRYRIVARLAAGGMATIFRAEQRAAPYEVAVKVLHPRFARDPAFARRFRREASVASLLAHPNVVRVLDYGGEGSCLFIVMELLQGEDLFELLCRGGPLDAARAVRIVIDVCEALSEAHGLGIVHRDLKPENVFLTRAPGGGDGVKILDFGIAKMLEPEATSPDSAPSATVIGTILGTPEYMSPEQCHGEAPGPRSDIYACGALLYMLLTGRPPFVGSSPMEILCKHVTEEPVPPGELRADLHPAIAAVVLKALAKSPEGRHASAATLAVALRAALAAATAPRFESECATLRPLAPEPPRAEAPMVVPWFESELATLRPRGPELSLAPPPRFASLIPSELATLRPRGPELSLAPPPRVVPRFASELATLRPRAPERSVAPPPPIAPLVTSVCATLRPRPLELAFVEPPWAAPVVLPAPVEVTTAAAEDVTARWSRPSVPAVPPEVRRRTRRSRALVVAGGVLGLALLVLGLAWCAPVAPAGRAPPSVAAR
jgi:serine/threonine-protein kinase